MFDEIDAKITALEAAKSKDPKAFQYSAETLALPVRKYSDQSSKPDGAGYVEASALAGALAARAAKLSKLI